MMHRRTGWCKASKENETVSADHSATGGGSVFLAEGGSFPISVEGEIAAFFKTLRQTAEQLTPLQRWYRVFSRALVKYLNGRELRPPPGLPAPA